MRNPEPEWDESESIAAVSKPARTVPWSARDAIIAVVFFIPISVMVAFVFFSFGALVSRLLFMSTPGYLQIISLGSASFVTSIAITWFVGIRMRGGTAADLGVTDFRIWLDVPLAVLGEIVAFVGLAVYALLLQSVAGLKVPEQDITSEFGLSTSGFALAFVFIVILAPLGEELFFRGFVYPAFRKRWGVGLAMVGSSALFAIFHLHPLLFMPMFIIGMVLAVLVEYRRSLAPAVILHALNNVIALVVVYNS